MNKNMYKKGKNANRTIKHRKKRNHNYKNTQRNMEKGRGGIMMYKEMKGGAICDDLSTINQSNLLDIFKYNIQVPKLVIPHIFEAIMDDLATGGPSSTASIKSPISTTPISSSSSPSSSSSSSSSSSISSSGSTPPASGSSSTETLFKDAIKLPFEEQLMYYPIAKDGDCFFTTIATQLNDINRQKIYPDFKMAKDITQQDVRNAIANYYRLPDNYKDLQDQAAANALFFGNMSDKSVNADTYINGIEGKQWGAEKEMNAIEHGALNDLTSNRQISVYVYGIRKGQLYNNGFGSSLNQATKKNSIPVIFFYNDKGVKGSGGGNHYDRLYFDAGNSAETLKLYQEFVENAKPNDVKIVEPSEANIKIILDLKLPGITRDEIINLLRDNDDDVNRVSNILLSR